MTQSSHPHCAEPSSTPQASSGGAPAPAGRGWFSSLLGKAAPSKPPSIEHKPHRKAGPRVGILVVHGVGEQTRFEQVETVASNFYLALKYAKKDPRLDVLHGDQAPLHSPEHSWRETPIVIHWLAGDGEPMEAWFREVHWADLDEPKTVWNWVRFICWALGVSGVRLYTKSAEGAMASMPDMKPPVHVLTGKEEFKVRVELFGISLLFFLMLISIDLSYFLSQRLSLRWTWIAAARATLYSYLGDIKLYQDRNRRSDKIEVLGQKSRVGIRRRMVRGLCRMAMEVEAGRLDGYYVIAHSLGTVVAWNGIMAPETLLAHYLSEKEWRALPSRFKKQGAHVHDCCDPPRPPWLTPGDSVDRSAFLSGLRGFMTLGSPLDKFAALWPAVVPTNDEKLAHEVPWINVADAQDIVAGEIDSFSAGAEAPVAHSFRLANHSWADQKTLLTAHTSYWSADARDRNRTIDRLIGWIESGRFEAPRDTMSPGLAKLVFPVGFLVLGLIPLGIVGTLIFVLGCVGGDDWVAQGVNMLLPGGDPGGACPADGGIWRTGHYWDALWRYALWILGTGVVVVGGMSVLNWLREKYTKPSGPDA